MKINYNRGLINQIEELTEQNERLVTENKRLRAENRDIRAKLSYVESTLEARINAAVEVALRKATEPLLLELASKNDTITKMGNEINRLKAQVNKDSNNSSKPPGQDGFKKKLNSREESTKKSGGQPGHAGKYMRLPENLDELIEKGQARLETIDHTNGSKTYVSRHTLDIDVTLGFS